MFLTVVRILTPPNKLHPSENVVGNLSGPHTFITPPDVVVWRAESLSISFFCYNITRRFVVLTKEENWEHMYF